MPRVDRANFICVSDFVSFRFGSLTISFAVLQLDLQTYQIKQLIYIGAGRQPTQSCRV
jgi:hypothetical protein